MEETANKVKCFIIAGGSNVFSEYEYKEGIKGIPELYWINPMLCDLTKDPTGRVAVGMAPLATFNKNDSIGPVNEATLIASYEIDPSLQNMYESQVLKLRAAKSGIVQAKSMPQQRNIGDGLKIMK